MDQYPYNSWPPPGGQPPAPPGGQQAQPPYGPAPFCGQPPYGAAPYGPAPAQQAPAGWQAPPPPAGPAYPQPYPPPYPAPVYQAPPYALGGPRRDPLVKGASRTMNRMCLCVIAQTAASFLWSLLFSALMTLGGVDLFADNMAYLWLSAALVPLSTALPFALYLLVGKKDLPQYLRFEKVGFLTGLLCVVGGLAICILGNYPAFFLQDLLGFFGYQPSSSVLGGESTWPSLALEFCSTAVLVPVMEEFAFRGVLFSALRKHGTGFAVVGSALVFAFVHLDASSVLFAFIAGLVFGFLYARTNNLWVTIAIHGLNNGIAVVSGYLDLFVPAGLADLVSSLLLLVPIALGLVALVVLGVFRRRLFPSRAWQETPCPLEAGRAAQATVRAPLFWVTAAMMLAYTAALFF